MIYNVSSAPPEAYEFEKIDNKIYFDWFYKNWYVSLYISALYLLSIISVRQYMKNRPPFHLQRVLTCWNLLLAIFSVAGTFRLLPGFIHILSEFGLTFSLCDNVYGYRLKGSLFWGWLFVFSKVIELGDTMFIILRKKKLIFLHWYHHVLTLVTVWYFVPHKLPISHWVAMMNFTVHSFMYTYYTLRTVNIKLSRFIPITITIMQISQMVIGALLILWVAFLQLKGQSCHFPQDLYKYGFLTYLSYAVLFCRYFYETYLLTDSGLASHLKKLD